MLAFHRVPVKLLISRSRLPTERGGPEREHSLLWLTFGSYTPSLVSHAVGHRTKAWKVGGGPWRLATLTTCRKLLLPVPREVQSHYSRGISPRLAPGAAELPTRHSRVQIPLNLYCWRGLLLPPATTNIQVGRTWGAKCPYSRGGRWLVGTRRLGPQHC